MVKVFLLCLSLLGNLGISSKACLRGLKELQSFECFDPKGAPSERSRETILYHCFSTHFFTSALLEVCCE